MSITAECVVRNRLTNGIKMAGFQFTDHFEDSFGGKGEHSFNITTSDGDQLEATWTIQSHYHEDYFEWMRIKLAKYNRNIYGNFVIQAEKIKFNDIGSFDTNSSPGGQYSAAIECSDTHFIKITIFIIYNPELMILSSISENYDRFLENQDLRDAFFDLRGEEISAHKQVLAAQSAKFAEIFAESMVSKNDRIELDDIEPKIFKLFLRFIYSGKLDTSSVEDLLKLMVAGYKYGVNSIVSFCGQLLSNELSLENAVEILMIADLAKEEVLKRKCIELIIKNKERISDTLGYREMVKSHRADLLSEIFLKTTHVDGSK